MRRAPTASKHPVLSVDLAEQQALVQRGAGVVLALRLLPRLRDDFRLALVRNDHDAVRIAEHDVAAAHANASTLDWYVTLHHAGAALGVERPDAAVEYGEAHGPNLADVADQSVCHTAGSATRDARCG